MRTESNTKEKLFVVLLSPQSSCLVTLRRVPCICTFLISLQNITTLCRMCEQECGKAITVQDGRPEKTRTLFPGSQI
jgi:hypothetical protein